MSNVYILEARRVEHHAASIRRKLASLRRAKAIRANGTVALDRNPALDDALANMIETHQKLERETARFKIRGDKLTGDTTILNTAETVLMDTAELIELLLWFGARSPAVRSGTLNPLVKSSL